MEKMIPEAGIRNPLVSVIIPVYNVAPYLREALYSVINQTNENLEIIVVDDGSTDGSGMICDEYRSDPRVTVIHQENQGVSSARNIGLDQATGKYIAFLDSDDAYDPDFFRLMLGAIENVDIVICQYDKHLLELNSIGEKALSSKEGLYDRVRALQGLFGGLFNIGVPNKLYRKDLWKHIRFPVGRNYEDNYVTFQIFDECKTLYFLDQPLYHHREWPGSITATATRKNYEDMNIAYDWVCDFVEAHYPEIYSEIHVRNVRQYWLSRKIDAYLKDYMNASEIKAACKGISIKGCSFRWQIIYQILRHSPKLMKVIYPVYQSSKRLVHKVFRTQVTSG